MTFLSRTHPGPGRAATAAAAVLTAVLTAALTLLTAPDGRASDGATAGSGAFLPLGDAGLTETRGTETLAPGVTLTRIVRGTEPAPADQINTTTRGPWVVNVLTFDPRRTRGHLAATHGPDLAGVEPTTALVREAGALAGVNASFFTFTANRQYPGDPVGLGLYDGRLLSEPTGGDTEADFVVDARSNRALMGRLAWSGGIRNRSTDATLPLEFLNHPPVVPAACAGLADQTRCAEPGDVVRFSPEFAAATPSGHGVEVVLDRRGCVVRTATARGTELAAGQASLQATGREAADLLRVAGQGCVAVTSTLVDERGDRLPVREGLFGVNGRYRLMADGVNVVPDGSGSFFARNPRTLAGTTADGRIVLATIDGRMTTSVGTTMDETAAVAEALGLHDAVNLDGGGSTAMSVGGELVNRPSGGVERAVGDALVFLGRPYRTAG
ncbi:phosphodiester glycosidase family protein [Streptomyces sp. DSM 44917]|uniref:Phosphodiester glycosidase family protein n=1 Tax=Streptomyces boetiae TaxID=3075541 RepID=A0ABU2L8G6_9ACTN|nr:phosphodiester glycosidase family protein [Streptomyces sp. DSM 44917]MDT0307508.1 phosphodiester glycosidase family protein [Streptomyces sp. DSM 44917]